jgi:hypothetical protein
MGEERWVYLAQTYSCLVRALAVFEYEEPPELFQARTR